MRVLWLSLSPSMYEDANAGTWVGAQEKIFRQYGADVKLGIFFEFRENIGRDEKNGVVYYPTKITSSKLQKLRLSHDYIAYANAIRDRLRQVVDDFKPDVIHCFGSEWPYGQIVKDIDIPVIIHMQGFWNIYTYMGQKLTTSKIYRVKQKIREILKLKSVVQQRAEVERDTMSSNKYFIGRTDWDYNIVKYYSPNAKYFYCPEAIRNEIYSASEHWHCHNNKQMRLVTISSGTTLKGNELILQTAKIMTDMGVDFHWRVTGDLASLRKIERKLKLRHEDLNIEHIGLICSKQISKELCENDIYVHTAIIDNSPNSLCEAQLMGIPVVTTYVGGIPQLVKNHETGIFFPYNEPHTLAFVLLNLFNDKEKMSALSEKEYTISHDRHNPEKLFARLMEIYNLVKNKS